MTSNRIRISVANYLDIEVESNTLDYVTLEQKSKDLFNYVRNKITYPESYKGEVS